jgi:hypothetical protein
MNDIRPVRYIEEVLQRLNAGETNYMALLPMNFVKQK